MPVRASMEAWVDLGCLPLTHLFVCLCIKSLWAHGCHHIHWRSEDSFQGSVFSSISLSQGLSSFYCTAPCTSGELTRDRLSNSSVPTTRLVGWQVVSPHWALFKCWVQGLLFSSGPLAELSLWPHIVSSVPESLMEPGAHQFCWNGCPARHTDSPVTSSQC